MNDGLHPLTFFCELESTELQAQFSRPGLIDQLVNMNAHISLGLIDLSQERAEIVRMFNNAGVPVHAWLLLPMDQGYWFNQGNAVAAVERYQDFVEWTRENGLTWQAVGIDIEPDIRLLNTFKKGLFARIRALLTRQPLPRGTAPAAKIYQALVKTIRADGFFVESYQLPFIIDDRLARSHFIENLTGIIDLPVDREILMLYSSFFRPQGKSILVSYAGQAGGIGLGSTGGGVDTEGIVDTRPLTWEELQRDLLIANSHHKPIYIFSLEGCVRQGYIEKIAELDWHQTAIPSNYSTSQITRIRRLLRIFLWVTVHPMIVVGVLAAPFIIARFTRRKKDFLKPGL